MLHLTAPATGGTPLRRRSSLGARPETPGAGLQPLNLNRLLNAGCRFFQRQLEIVPQVGAGFGGIAVDPAAPPAEKHVKDVIERTKSPAGHILGGDRLWPELPPAALRSGRQRRRRYSLAGPPRGARCRW